MTQAPREPAASAWAVDDDGPPPDPVVATTGRGRGRVAATARFLLSLWPPAVVLGALLAVWWLVAPRPWVPNYLIPRPAQGFQTKREQWPMLAHNNRVKLYESLPGFVVAVLL